VSIFFTLSGFLITSLLVGEHQSHGSISLRDFWARRFRRLLPASWLTVGLVVLAGAFGLWTNSQMRGLLADVPAALGQVFNWRQIAGGQSYGAQFAAPSPLEHYWSLAIEEQFYVLFPLLVAGCGALARRRRWSMRTTVGTMAAVIVAGSATASLIVGPAGSRAYLGTDTRAGELAIGALLAVVMVGRGPIKRFWPRALAQLAGVAALAYWVWSWNTVTLSDRFLYPWGLLLTAVATSLVIVAVLQRGGLATAVGSAPLRALGRISYGVYLLHWPIGRLLTPDRTGLGPWPLFFLQTTVSLAAATLSYHYIEMPIRRGRRIGFPRTALIGAVAAAVLLVGNVAVNNVKVAATAITKTTVNTVAPTRVLLIGDQLAGSLGPALAALPKAHYVSQTVAEPDCGLVVGGWVQLADGRVESDADRCGPVDHDWQTAEANFRPDVVVVWGGMRDVANRRLGNDVPWQVPPASASLDQFLDAGLRARIGAMAAHGAKVVVLTHAGGCIDHRARRPAPVAAGAEPGCHRHAQGGQVLIGPGRPGCPEPGPRRERSGPGGPLQRPAEVGGHLGTRHGHRRRWWHRGRPRHGHRYRRRPDQRHRGGQIGGHRVQGRATATPGGPGGGPHGVAAAGAGRVTPPHPGGHHSDHGGG